MIAQYRSSILRWSLTFALTAAIVSLSVATPEAVQTPSRQQPNVVVITIDTLRADRLSGYGYRRPTSPNLDRVLAGGARFAEARTVEPLTTPALGSMITSRYPHEHGASRNGLRLRSGFASLPKALQAHGYRTAAFVGNWTLRDKLSGLGEHFEVFTEVLNRRRWLGLIRGEATAEDLTGEALDWLEAHHRSKPRQPFMLWVHYVEPHAPYRLWPEYREPLGITTAGNPGESDRYDTEIAYVDHWVGELLRQIESVSPRERTLVVVTSDHGESLGEHNYWGHGRHLYEPSLRIPLGIQWAGNVAPQVVESPALIIDVAPTVLGLLGQRSPAGFQGYDWTSVLSGGKAPKGRLTLYQAHRGAVISGHDSDLRRQAGLLAVGSLVGNRKEVVRIENGRRQVFDLGNDPRELIDLMAGSKEPPSEAVLEWLNAVANGLSLMDQELPEALDEESAQKLRALGYVD